VPEYSWAIANGKLMSEVLAMREGLARELRSSGGDAKAPKARLILGALWGLVLACAPLARGNDIAVVLNKNVNVQSVTTSDLVRICKGDLTHWPGGQALTLVILEPESPAMKIVNEKLYKLSAVEVRALFSGSNRTPTNHHSMIMVGSPAELVRVVASKPGAIGLVDVYSITGAVSVAKVDDKLPLQPGYCLHGN
jgi:ABC-type phosphate transport system substrate-binding protein